MQHWYVIQVKPNSERIACKHLQNQKFDIFAPQQKLTKRQGTQFKTQLKPLFPGYMFVRFDAQHQNWRKINATHGVSRLITLDGKLTPLASGFVDTIAKCCDETGAFQPQIMAKEGLSAEIATGPFAGFIGKITEVQDDQRVWLLLDFVGQKTRVQLSSDQINIVDVAS